MLVNRKLLLYFIFFIPLNVWCNNIDSNTIILSSIYYKLNEHGIDKTQKCWFYESKDKLSIQDITTTTIEFEKLDISKHPLAKYKQHWLKFKIYNDYCDSKRIAIGTGQNNYVDIYLLRNDSIFYHTQCGFLEHPLKLNNSTSYFSEVSLPSQTTTEIIIECNNFLPNSISTTVNIYNQDIINPIDIFFYTYINYYESIFFFGCVFFAFFFVLALYYYFRHQIYLSYLFYISTLLVFAFFGLERVTVLLHLLHLPPELYYYLHEPSLFLFSGSYGFFILKILDINKTNYSKLYWWITIMSTSILIWFLCLLCWIHFYDFKHHDIIINLSIAIVQIYSVITFISLFWVQSIYKNLILLGMGTLLMLGIFTFVFDDILHYEITVIKDLKLSYFVFLKLGFLLELLFFAMALGKRTYILEQEKNNNYKNYINELELKNELENKVNEFRNKALRAQINPHFLFNSLNAINYLISNEELDKAADYINKFAKLFRNILDFSRQEVITLENELSACKLYLSIEQERLNNNFTVNYSIDDNIDLNAIKIPSLLLQPYIENAIWHGLHNSSALNKLIEFNIEEDPQNNIIISIYDNGIGRAAAASIKKFGNNKSQGLIITQERISIFNQINKSKISLAIIDQPENKNCQGTLVLITINQNYED